MGWRRDHHRQPVRHRTTKPKELYAAARAGVDIVGDRNDEAIREATAGAMRTVAAWGAHGRLLGRGAIVVGAVDQPLCLGTTTRRGEPRHPLYVPQATEPTAYKTNGGGDRPA